MARLIFSMNVSLDGFVDHDRFAPDAELFRHWIDIVAGLEGSIYGRRIYELMRYWDDDDPAWSEAEHAFAAAWRRQPKWVLSRGRPGLGPNATLLEGDAAGAIREVKARHGGEIAIAGPDLARTATEAGLIDEYRLYVHPVVLGGGAPFFAGTRPALRLAGTERFGPETVRLTCVPA